MNERLDSLFTIAPGAGAGGYKGFTLGVITQTAIIECVVYAAIGAAIGYSVKLLLDCIFKNKKKPL